MGSKRKIGITTTVPVEVILAAGLTPVDLNNVFITGRGPADMVAGAEARGFPPNLCSWIKGIYSAVREQGIEKVIGVVRGDCSSAEKLLEIWRHEGVETIAFSYPAQPDPKSMEDEIACLAKKIGTAIEEAERVRRRLLPVRSMLRELDDMTWQEGRVSGEENHLWLVSASDFNRDPKRFEADLSRFLDQARSRPEEKDFIRLGYAGVPPIITDLYQYLEAQGARVVFNEVQRQFAMPGEYESLAGQYSSYTYPYDTFRRLQDIKSQIQRRGLAGIIHYAQTFCHRQLESILLRETLPVPVLTIEADKPGPLEAGARTRIDAFLEQMAK
jgi:benzoyl-CoA reductase/2-hydroxyglutaryl-CoA dehydratase subunit BcrC/BadD/HgdB